MEKKKGRSRKGQKAFYYGALTFFALVFLGSAIYIGNYMVQSYRSKSEYDDLAARLESIRNAMTQGPTAPPVIPGPPPTDPDGNLIPTDPPAPTEPVMLPDYAPFYQINNDLVGWITVPDTKINYPVMQTGSDRKDFYLKHNFDKKWSDWGAIYIREECDTAAPSDNITVYGHHMKDGSMFAGLDKYKKEAFWKDHQTFSFDTLYERHTYQIFAVFKTSGSYGVGFPYHLFVDAADQADFDRFVSQIKKMSFYDTGITAEYGDKLLCLSTCEYSQDNGRFVVVAKRIS